MIGADNLVQKYDLSAVGNPYRCHSIPVPSPQPWISQLGLIADFKEKSFELITLGEGGVGKWF